MLLLWTGQIAPWTINNNESSCVLWSGLVNEIVSNFRFLSEKRKDFRECNIYLEQSIENPWQLRCNCYGDFVSCFFLRYSFSLVSFVSFHKVPYKIYNLLRKIHTFNDINCLVFLSCSNFGKLYSVTDVRVRWLGLYTIGYFIVVCESRWSEYMFEWIIYGFEAK